MNNFIKCPFCNQVIAELKKGEIQIIHSTNIKEPIDTELEIERKCPRCHRFLTIVKK